MKPKQLVDLVRLYAGLAVDEGQIIWWEKKGLLGKVPRTLKNRRDYTSLNANLCMVVVVCKLLRWGLGDVERLVKNKDKDLKAKFIGECNVLVDKFTPKLKEIIKEVDRII